MHDAVNREKHEKTETRVQQRRSTEGGWAFSVLSRVTYVRRSGAKAAAWRAGTAVHRQYFCTTTTTTARENGKRSEMFRLDCNRCANHLYRYVDSSKTCHAFLFAPDIRLPTYIMQVPIFIIRIVETFRACRFQHKVSRRNAVKSWLNRTK